MLAPPQLQVSDPYRPKDDAFRRENPLLSRSILVALAAVALFGTILLVLQPWQSHSGDEKAALASLEYSATQSNVTQSNEPATQSVVSHWTVLPPLSPKHPTATVWEETVEVDHVLKDLRRCDEEIEMLDPLSVSSSDLCTELIKLDSSSGCIYGNITELICGEPLHMFSSKHFSEYVACRITAASTPAAKKWFEGASYMSKFYDDDHFSVIVDQVGNRALISAPKILAKSLDTFASHPELGVDAYVMATLATGYVIRPTVTREIVHVPVAMCGAAITDHRYMVIHDKYPNIDQMNVAMKQENPRFLIRPRVYAKKSWCHATTYLTPDLPLPSSTRVLSIHENIGGINFVDHIIRNAGYSIEEPRIGFAIDGFQ